MPEPEVWLLGLENPGCDPANAPPGEKQDPSIPPPTSPTLPPRTKIQSCRFDQRQDGVHRKIRLDCETHGGDGVYNETGGDLPLEARGLLSKIDQQKAVHGMERLDRTIFCERMSNWALPRERSGGRSMIPSNEILSKPVKWEMCEGGRRGWR